MIQKNKTIDFLQLQIFSSVVHHGGITAAAKALGTSKSTVSLQITRLEKLIGVRLLERNSRRVALTREGELLLPRIQSLLAEANNLLAETVSAQSVPRGIVRIAVTPPLGGAVMERLVPTLRKQFPDISLVVVPNYDVDDLKNPTFDFAIRVGHILDESLVAKNVGSFSRILVCAPSHPAADFISPHMLQSADLLTFSNRSTDVDWRMVKSTDSSQSISLKCQAKFASQDFNLLLKLARLGLGVAAVPDFMAKTYIDTGSLVRVLPEWRSPPIDVMLAYRPGASRVSRIAAVLKEAKQSITSVLADSARTLNESK